VNLEALREAESLEEHCEKGNSLVGDHKRKRELLCTQDTVHYNGGDLQTIGRHIEPIVFPVGKIKLSVCINLV